jgi:hypothetical protein
VTDGEWVWHQELTTYADLHDLAIPQGLLDRIASAGFSVPNVTDDQKAEALALLTSGPGRD